MKRLHILTLPRSGGTLANNLLRECIPGFHITNGHTSRKDSDNVIIIIRDIRDCLVSIMKCRNYSLLKAILIYIRAIKQTEKTYPNQKYIYIKYEDFYKDYSYLINRSKTFLNVKVDDESMNKLEKKYSMDNAREIVSKLSGFDDIDSKTNLHGNHIYNGHIENWKTEFTPKLQFIIYLIFKKWLIKYGYYRDGKQ